MTSIAIMDTSILSFNLGDQIIMESARKGLASIIEDAFVVNMPTHSPLFHKYEFSIRKEDSFRAALNQIDYKFVCGTNLIEKNMKKRKNSWNLHLSDLKYMKDFILVGVGSDGLEIEPNMYTRKFYRQALSPSYYHSTRDEKTKQFLEKMGIMAVNTGCVTLWPLTSEHCEKIPKHKADKVVFTVTDYKPDPLKDAQFINVLLSQYREVACWLQGLKDEKYLRELEIPHFTERVHIIKPSLYAYTEYLYHNECDYIGTRLHAGIKAMQMGKRSIILGVDNRAKDMNDDFNLNYLDRNRVEDLKNYIESEIHTKINIPVENIDFFMEQFQR